MRDDDRCSAKCELPETLEPVCFGPRIESAGGLVENDNRSLPQKGARECDALPLADAQLRSACEPAAQQRLLVFGQARNDLFRACGPKCCFDFSVSRVEFQIAVKDVIADGAVVVKRLLKENGD